MSFIDVFRLVRPDHSHCHGGRGLRRSRHGAWPNRTQARTSVGGGGGDRWLGNADLRLRVLAAHPDLGLRRCPGKTGATAMMNVLLLGYIAILALFVWLGLIPFNRFWKISPVIVALALVVGLFIPMGWGAPSGPAVVARNSVQIVPSVAGEVVEVPVVANTPLKEGDVLFRIDPTTYQAQVQAIEAQIKFAELRLSQMSQLQSQGTGRTFDVQQRESEVEQLRAQLDGAKWNLDKTTVRAPANGYVTNLALRKGARVANLPLAPVMAFIDTSDTLIGVEIAQIDARYIEPGQPVEVTFKFMPGQVYSGKVESILQAIATGQVQTSGLAVTPKGVPSAPFVVRIRLDDTEIARRLPAGSTGDAAIYTDHVKLAHVIRKVLLRQIAITNYVNPF